MKRGTAGLTVAAATGLILGACAPLGVGANGYGPGVGVGLGYGFSMCGSPLGYSAQASRLGISTSPVMRARAIQARVQQIQARASFGYTATPSMEAWKQVASGDC